MDQSFLSEKIAKITTILSRQVISQTISRKWKQVILLVEYGDWWFWKHHKRDFFIIFMEKRVYFSGM